MRRSADKDLLISQRARALGRSENPEGRDVIRSILNERVLFLFIMAIRVVEFSNGGYKIRNIFA